MSPDDPRHGQRATYLKGCTCDRCTEANATYCKRYRARRYANGGNLRVDATAAREHLKAMNVHYSRSSLGELAGINSSAVYRIISGQQQRITRIVERRILAIHLGHDVGTHWVNATPAARRIQALCALGYSINGQSQRLNYSKQNMYSLITGEKPFITSAIDQKIRAHYAELSMLLPPTRDRFQRAAITKAKKMARSNGWPPPLAWDNIDDPDEKPKGMKPARYTPTSDLDPVKVDRILRGDYELTATPAERREVVRRWAAEGRPLTELERLTGWNTNRYRDREVA